MKKIFIFWLCFVWSFSQDVISTDRPGQGENPETLVPRRFQVEAGSGYSFLLLPSSDPFFPILAPYSYSNLLLRYAISQNWEMRFVGNYSVIFQTDETPQTSSFSPWEIGTKIRLLEGKETPFLVSYLAHLKGFPESRSFGTMHKILLAYSFAKKWTFYAYAGYQHTQPNINAGMYMLNIVFQPWKMVSFYAQVYDNELFARNYPRILFVPEVGGTLLMRHNIQLDYSFGYNYFGALWEIPYVSLGISFYLAKKKQ